MKTIDLVIPCYTHNLTNEDYLIIFDKLVEHKSLIKKFNNDSLGFDGLIIQHSIHNNQVHGWILSDSKQRASDGDTVITSPIKMKLQLENYSNVSIVRTQNSKYLVIG